MQTAARQDQKVTSVFSQGDPQGEAQQCTPHAEVRINAAIAQKPFLVHNAWIHVETPVEHVIEHAVEGESQRIEDRQPPRNGEQCAGPKQHEDEQHYLQLAVVAE